MLNKLRVQKSKLIKSNFIENIIFSKLQPTFNDVQIKKIDDENYEVTAEKEGNQYLFLVFQNKKSRYALENVIFNLETVSCGSSTMNTLISFLFKDSLTEVIGLYLHPYAEIAKSIENSQSKINYLIEEMEKDLKNLSGFKRCEDEERYIEIGEQLVVHSFYSNTVTLSIIPYNHQFNISLQLSKENLIKEWKSILPKLKIYLEKKYQPQHSEHNLFELFDYYFKLNNKVRINWDSPHFCISNIVLGSYDIMQVSAELLYNEENEMISVCIESLGEYMCEEKPFFEVISYLEEIEQVIC